MGKVIITGANGFLGKNLVHYFVEKKTEVVAIDVFFSEELLENPSVKCIDCKDKNTDDIYELIKDESYSCFFHLAWKATSGPERANYLVQLDNVKLVCDYIMLAKKLNCKRFVYASSINEIETYEYLQSDNIEPTGGYIYGTGKLAGHLIGEVVAYQNEIDFIPVIITNIYGAGEKSARMINTAIRKLLAKEHCSFTEGYQTYDFIYITDAINSIGAVGEKGKAFNRYYIGSGSPKELRSFLLEMRDVVDHEAELGLGDIPFKGVDISYDQFDLHKVYTDTGYKNEISFKEGIRLTKEYIEQEK